MGSGASYSVSARMERATLSNFAEVRTNLGSVFKQQDERKAHESMLSQKAQLREARDSANHPETLPIILGLDVTGSMEDLPKALILDGLPTIMGKLIDNKLDPALLFCAIGDHECDSFPFQVGQFEASDPELDLWLTRTFIEGRGGGNDGESYMLPWYFAMNNVQTDHWDKRKKKGYIFTIGDEPTLKMLPAKSIQEIFDHTGEGVSSLTLLKAAQERYHVFHIHIDHSWRRTSESWEKLIGENLIKVKSANEVASAIVSAITRIELGDGPTDSTTTTSTTSTETGDDMM